MEPYDLATVILPGMERKAQLEVLASLPPARVAETLEHLPADQQYWFLDHLPGEKGREVLNEMSSDAAVDLLLSLHPRQRSQLLEWLAPQYREEISRLMAYPENTAGGLATVDYIAVREYWTAGEAIEHVRKVGREAELIYYLYVLDAQGHLVGVASLREVLLADPRTPLGELMKREVISVPARADQEEVGRILSRYDLLALPVVDDAGRMMGIVTVDDILDVLEEEATEDIQRLGGVQPVAEPYLQASLGMLFRKRVGWLLMLYLAEAFTGTVMRHYESFLSRMVALAFFVPLLIGTGGNAGSQASSLIIRALAVGEVTPAHVLRVIWRESRLGLVLGLAMGVAGAVRALLLGTGGSIALTVGLAQVAIVLWASLVGALLPLLGKKMGMDPAVFSAPLIATATDALGLIIYFEIARLTLGL